MDRVLPALPATLALRKNCRAIDSEVGPYVLRQNGSNSMQGSFLDHVRLHKSQLAYSKPQETLEETVLLPWGDFLFDFKRGLFALVWGTVRPILIPKISGGSMPIG